MPLDDTISVGQTGHIADHQVIAAEINKYQTAGAVSVYRTTTQNIVTATGTTVLFDNELFDTHGFHDNVTNSERLTVPAGMGGKYVVSGMLRYSANGTGIRLASIARNGTGSMGEAVTLHAGSADEAAVSVSTVVTLADGDYVSLVGFHTAGSTLTIIGGSSTLLRTFLAMARIGG